MRSGKRKEKERVGEKEDKKEGREELKAMIQYTSITGEERGPRGGGWQLH